MRPAAFVLILAALATTESAQTAHYRHARGGHFLNDLSVTPGDALPHVNTATICKPGYTARPGVRLVAQDIKDSVYRLYGATKLGDAQHPPSCCEVDHLISLELGGSNSVKNLWPACPERSEGSPTPTPPKRTRLVLSEVEGSKTPCITSSAPASFRCGAPSAASPATG